MYYYLKNTNIEFNLECDNLEKDTINPTQCCELKSSQFRSLYLDIHCGRFLFENQCLISSFQFSLIGYDYHAEYRIKIKLIYRLTKDQD